MSDPIATALTQYLQQQQVSYHLLHHQRPATSIEDAAQQRGIRPAQMVKCILLRDMSDRYVLACAPGDRSVDPKKVRALFGYRRMTCVDKAEVAEITGYEIGTVTPLLLKTNMPIVFDSTLLSEPWVTISSGNLMAGLKLELKSLLSLCQPQLAAICREPSDL
ncbi:aminoacyl-tRNA deacylase [Vibrio navarrensis]|uniref:aminoacyl-tRNA deacylase n=1 Tax=Vibrio navarrensis TaxID=29495 RepID=UPI00051D424D|nr:YbaK/EbsC family protein [Vibrio navarrensis]KGK18516.1 regulatory protein [Vibrio navarrensis]